MVEHTDLYAGLRAAVAAMGPLSRHDRTYIFELTDALASFTLVAEWNAPGVEGIEVSAGTAVFASAAFPEVLGPLLDDLAYQSRTHIKPGTGKGSSGTRCDLIVPIHVGGKLWGCIGFDNCKVERQYDEAEIQILRAAATAVASAVHRTNNETQHRRDARRHEQLLAAVNEASAHLVEQSDLNTGMSRALRALRTNTGVDRVFINRYNAREQATYPWLEDRREDLQPFSSGFGPGPWPDDVFAEVAYPLREGRTYRSTAAQRTGANALANQTIESVSDLIVPIFLHGHYRACIGFDDSTQGRQWSEADVAVLQTAASAMAAALARHEAESERLSLERRRTEEAHVLNHLLEGVVRSSRALLDESDFKAGLHRWLDVLARSVHADVAMLGTFVDAQRTDAVAHYTEYWSHDRHTRSSSAIPVTTDFTEWRERLYRGESVWAQREQLIDPLSVRFWEKTRCRTNLLMPVVCGGRAMGWLGFNWSERREWQPAFAAALRPAADGLAAAMQREQAQQAMLSERERRIALEQARADEAARHAARTERHACLLAAVAESAEELLSTRDLEASLEAVLCRVGRATSADRVVLTKLTWTPKDAERHGTQAIAHEWARPGAVRQSTTPMQRIDMYREDSTWDAMWQQLDSHGRLLALIADLDEPFRSSQTVLGVVWTLAYPVEVDGTLKGLLCFDYSTPREHYDEADLGAIQTVASSISDAMWRHELQERALAAERERADESNRLAMLLEHVVRSSRELINAELQAFEPALKVWLGEFGSATAALRSTFYDLVEHAPTGQQTVRMLCEWVREGVTGSVPVSFDNPYTVDPRGAETLMERLTSGQVVAVHTDDTHGPMRSFLEQQGNATVLCVPLFMDGRQWGCISIDHAMRHEPKAGEAAVLQTAADTLAAVLKRNEAMRQLLAEREQRLQAELRRSAELARANAALRSSLEALAESANEEGFMRQTLLEIGSCSGAAAVHLFRCDLNDSVMRLVSSVCNGKVSHDQGQCVPPVMQSGLGLAPSLRNALLPRNRLYWTHSDPATKTGEEAQEPPVCESPAPTTHALNALLVGERLVGVIEMVFDADITLLPAQEELLHALCQPLTLAIELARLAKQAQRSGEQTAVLSERNRLAREIHDGIAQSFLAIQMQIDSLNGDMRQLPPVIQAMAMARHGLTEARRAVAALRPHDLLNRDLPAGLKRLLEQMTSGTGIATLMESPPAWQRLPLDVEDHLFRIVQEAMNNVLKHARANKVRIELSQAGGDVTVLVVDDGCGFDPRLHLHAAGNERGYGLEGMHQRAKLIGATVACWSQLGKGTQILVSWSAAPAATN